MSFLRTYLYYNYKLAVRTRDRIKAPGLIFLGKLGDKIYKSPIVVIVYCIASILILTFFAGYSAEVMPSDPKMGLNFIMLVPAFFITQVIFDWFGQNNQLSSYQTLYIINSLSVKERVKLIFWTEFFGMKFVALLLCVSILQVCNSIYFGIFNYSFLLPFLFFVSLFVIYNSVVSCLQKYVNKMGNKIIVILITGIAVASLFIAEYFLKNTESKWSYLTTEVFHWLRQDPYFVVAFFGFSLVILGSSIFISKASLRNSWRY